MFLVVEYVIFIVALVKMYSSGVPINFDFCWSINLRNLSARGVLTFRFQGGLNQVMVLVLFRLETFVFGL